MVQSRVAEKHSHPKSCSSAALMKAGLRTGVQGETAIDGLCVRVRVWACVCHSVRLLSSTCVLNINEKLHASTVRVVGGVANDVFFSVFLCLSENTNFSR